MSELLNLWNETEAAQEYVPVPPGKYRCRLVSGQLNKTQQRNTPNFKIVFEVIGGEHDGHRLTYRIWLTPKAMPYAKRDLKRLDITEMDQLERPVKPFLCDVSVALTVDEDEVEHNRVRTFAVVGVEEPDAFAPEVAC